MFRWVRWAALAALGMAAASCGGAGRANQDASSAIQGFLAAVQSQDLVAFDARVDRPAVRREMRAQIVDLGRAAGVEVDGGPSEFALNRMISPSNIRLVTAARGEPLASSPKLEQIKPLLRKLDKTHVCLHDLTARQLCVLTFEKQKAGKTEAGVARPEGWRLVKMPATMLTVEIPAAPPPKK